MLSDNLWQKCSNTNTLCVNPGSNGICSLTAMMMLTRSRFLRLNPCSNGICSLTGDVIVMAVSDNYGLNPCSNGICSLTS